MVLQTAVGGDQEDEYEVQESELEDTALQKYFAKFAAKAPIGKKKNPINKKVKKTPFKQTLVSKNIVMCMQCILDKFDYRLYVRWNYYISC